MDLGRHNLHAKSPTCAHLPVARSLPCPPQTARAAELPKKTPKKPKNRSGHGTVDLGQRAGRAWLLETRPTKVAGGILAGPARLDPTPTPRAVRYAACFRRLAAARGRGAPFFYSFPPDAGPSCTRPLPAERIRRARGIFVARDDFRRSDLPTRVAQSLDLLR